MTPSIFHALTGVTRAIAHHSDPAYRFWMAMGLLCDLSLQNDPDGILIAIDCAEEFASTGTPSEMDVPLVRNPSGNVIDILHHEAGYAGHTLVELAREIALTSVIDSRLVALEAACLWLIQDKGNGLDDLLSNAARLRAEGLGVEALGFPLARDFAASPSSTTQSYS